MTIDADAPELVSIDGPQSGPMPDFLVDDGYWLGDATSLRGAVLPVEGEGRARGLLEMESPRVYLGAAALMDSELVERMAQAYGSERIGVFVPAARMEVSWALETRSNADFKTVAPSRCQPGWEILDGKGDRTGAEVHWWLGAMFERGASSAIVQVDMRDDDDLNICAALVEAFGRKVWFAPRSAEGNDFDDWMQWGKVTRLALPFAVREREARIRRGQETEEVAACASA